MAGEVDQLRQAGFSEDEIQSYVAPQTAALTQAGFSPAEIGAHLGVKPIDHGKAQRNLAERVYDGVVRAGKVAEGVLSVGSGLVVGFPTYLLTGAGAAIAHYTGYSPDNDPKEIATELSQQLTYDPRSDTGKDAARVLSYPFELLSKWKEKAGKAVARGTGSAPLAAITDETIGMLPAILMGALGRSMKKAPPENSDMHLAAVDIVEGAAQAKAPVTEAQAFAATKEVASKLQDTYEKTGIDPETLKADAVKDPVILQDLVSDNKTPTVPFVEAADFTGKTANDMRAIIAEGHPDVAMRFSRNTSGAVDLTDIQAKIPGRGDGPKAMETFTRWLDQNGHESSLLASATGDVPLAKVVEFYKKHGYTEEVEQPFHEGVVMRRDPQGQANGQATNTQGRSGGAQGVGGNSPASQGAGSGGASQSAAAQAGQVGGGAPPAPPNPPPPSPPPAAGSPAAAQAAVLARVSTEATPRKGVTFADVYTAFKDELYPINRIERGLNDGNLLPTHESPHKLAVLVRGAGGKATQFLDHATFDFNTYKNTGPGLREILKPFENDLDGFRAYAVAKRAEELHARGIDTGVPPAEAALVVKNGKQYEAAFKQLQTYQNSLVKYLKDSGLLSDDAFTAMLDANKDYVPFHRVIEGKTSGGTGGGLRSHNPVKGIKGSERIIVDPLESIIKNTYLYTALAERNAVGAAFGALVKSDLAKAEALGIKKVPVKVKPITITDDEIARLGGSLPTDTAMIFRPNAMRPEPNQIRYYDKGKPVTLEVPPDVANAFTAADRQSAGMLLKILSVPATVLRAGVVLSPDFLIKNPLVDQLTAFTFSKNGFYTPVDAVHGAMAMAKKSADFQDWLKSGGAHAAIVSIDREYMQQALKPLNSATGLMDRSWNVVTKPIQILQLASEISDSVTRVGDFRKGLQGTQHTKADIQEAGFNSREVTLDFQRIGAQAHGLNMISAFFNVGLEGGDRTVRAFKDNPLGTSAKVAAAITLPSILMWYANNNTPERQARYRDVPAWERDMFYIVMTDDHIFRIKKPFEAGVLFGSLPERMLDKFAVDKPEAMKGFMNSVGQAFLPGIIPTFAGPPLEHMTGHSFFTDQPLIPRRMEGLLPEYQFNSYTTELSKAAGQLVGAFPGLHDKQAASPIVIDNYVRGWTGSLGSYVFQALDAGLRKTGVLPDPPQPISTLADIPVVRAFVVRYPSATAQSVQDFYEDFNKHKKVYDTFLSLLKNGDPEAAMKEIKLDPSAFARMDGIHESLGTLNTIIRLAYRNPDMSPSDKRQLIDSMYGQMITMSRAGNQIMREVDTALNGSVAAEAVPAPAGPPSAAYLENIKRFQKEQAASTPKAAPARAKLESQAAPATIPPDTGRRLKVDVNGQLQDSGGRRLRIEGNQ